MKISEIQVTPIHPERWGDDLDVVNAARVSFHKEASYDWYDVDGRGPACSPSPCGEYFNIAKIKDGDIKLIHYLARHKHFSPFNHSFLSFRIKAPIFVARQLVKHKFMPWNEVSRRYVDEEPEFYFPDYWRKKADNVKQGSGGVLPDQMQPSQCFEKAVEISVIQYSNLLENGVAPEQARMILPQNMMTEWIWSGTLGAFLDMLVLRLDPHTQKESRDVAQLIAQHVKEIFPVSFNARIN